MSVVRISLLAGVLAGSSCCLSVVSGNEVDETSGGGSSSGGGGGTTGGTTTGAMQGDCAGVYCSPSYVCDPTDGICKCGGQVCTSGNCDPSTGACLPGGCNTEGGVGFIQATQGEAVMLPPADLNKTYTFQIGACPALLTFTALSQLPPGLVLYPSGNIEGVPIMATNGVPFEFEVEAQSRSGAVAYQNFLLQVIGSPGGP